MLIDLEMEWSAADMPHPFGMTMPRPNAPDLSLTTGAPLAAVFEQFGHRLLFLGVPGAGKTTVMLDLARTLLDRAESAPHMPIPVVFTLSSWPGKEKPMADWLVDELRARYDVPEKLARYWIEHCELALFLDGLDEVASEHRSDAIAALETLRISFLALWLVVCCRQADYEELAAQGTEFEHVNAVRILPLTPVQIEAYLASLSGPIPMQLRAAIAHDPALLEVADTPLMLNVMLLAGDTIVQAAPASADDPDVPRTRIYDAYLSTIFTRFRSGPISTSAEIVLYLQWLASKMIDHGQTVFLLERMKRSWFNRPWQCYLWSLVLGLVFGLIGTLSGGLVGGFIGITVGTVLGLRHIAVQEQMHFRTNLSDLRNGLVAGIASTTVVVTVFTFIGGLNGMLNTPTCIELGDFSSLSAQIGDEYWCYSPDSTSLVPSTKGTPTAQEIDALVDGLRIGLIVGLVFGFLIGLLIIMTDRSTSLELSNQHTKPNSGIRQLSRFGIIYGLIFVFSAGTVFGVLYGVIAGMNAGIIGGLIGGLLFGWADVIKHYILRCVLALDGSMPLNYVRFLDHCVDRILLRKVGGGYIFIHRTFMEHMANIDPSTFDFSEHPKKSS